MPVAAVEKKYSETKDRSGTSRRRRKSSTICTTSLDSEAAHSVSLAFHADDQTNTPSFLQCHSPILDLSPNMSPESQPNSGASPVFELLDSSNRRTVQGELGLITSLLPTYICPSTTYLLLYYGLPMPYCLHNYAHYLHAIYINYQCSPTPNLITYLLLPTY